MAKVVVIANQKGGVGKTTTAINLSACVASFFKDILLIDIDPQSNATTGLGLPKGNTNSIYRIFVDNVDIVDLVWQTEFEWLQIVPSSIDLAGAEVEILNSVERQLALKSAIDKIRGYYDYIIVDSPPSLGVLTTSALSACDAVLIPVQPEYYALEGLATLIRLIEMVSKRVNPNLYVEGVVVTMYDSRLNLAKQVVDELRKFFGNKLYKTFIPRSVRAAEAPSFGKPIICYDKSSVVSSAYVELAKEFLERNG